MGYVIHFCGKMWMVWLFLVGALHLVAGYRQNRPAAIIGGNPVEVGNVPYMAALQMNKSGGFLCGASIVDERFILTAAHCVQEPTKYFVVVGSSRHDKNGDKYTVDKIIMHPNYSDDTYEYDAALLRVSKPIDFSEDVQKINLLVKKERLKEGDLLTATGWGKTETGDISNDLLITKLPFVPNKICQCSYEDGGITENMLCAGGKEGQDTCWGDSGGPLVYQNVQVGITSFGNDPCGTTVPGVYTRLYSIRHWISKTIKGCYLNVHGKVH